MLLKIFFLAFVEFLGFVAGALGGVEGGFAREVVVAALGAGLVQDGDPFGGGGDEILERFAHVGVGLVKGVEVVLQLVGDVSELL